MPIFILVEDPREDGEVLLITKDERVAIRGAIEMLRQNFMDEKEPDEPGHIWENYKVFDSELEELGEAAFWHKYNSAWCYSVCIIYEMELMG